MILIELSLYFAFTDVSVISSYPKFILHVFFRFLVFSPCFVLKQLHMCCLINIMLLPLAIPFTLLTLSMLPNIVSYQNFAFVDAHLLNLNLNLNSLLVKRQIDNPSPGAVTGGN